MALEEQEEVAPGASPQEGSKHRSCLRRSVQSPKANDRQRQNLLAPNLQGDRVDPPAAPEERDVVTPGASFQEGSEHRSCLRGDESLKANFRQRLSLRARNL
ncbi:MAG: hypothetical protein K2X93_00425 [Candidatus Obscuribacterales bacterium]|nr:hypothetical protein [Candidatus Obscuribacterales bacterium]